MVQRGLFCAAAAVMACAIGAAVLQLAVLVLGMSSPVAITVITLVALALLNSLRRRLRPATRHRFGHGMHR
jgi:membrane protein implicated in regulation of membrane protease activity